MSMFPGSFLFNVRPNILYWVQVWTLTMGQNMSLMDLFSSHVLVVFAVWAGVLSF